MSIRYRSYTALDYKLMPIGNEISCINLKEKIRKEESLTDKSTNIILSFENARGNYFHLTTPFKIITISFFPSFYR